MTRYRLDETTVTIEDDTDKLMYYLHNLEVIANN